jgi:protein-disulfide isomerase
MSDQIDEDSSQEQDQQYPLGGDEGGQQPDSAKRRLRVLGKWVGVAAVLAAAVVVVVVLATSRGGAQAQPASARGSATVQRINALLAGIPQSGSALGMSTAPVTLQFFGDLECPTSRAFTLATLPSLIARWVRGGELRIEYRSLETATREPAVFTAQQAAALAAGMQGRLWYYVELFYHEQGREDSGYVTASYLDGLAGQTHGLELALWSKDRVEPPLAAEVATDEQSAARLGFHSTPSFLIGRTGSGRLEKLLQFSVLESTAFNAAIERVLNERPRSRSSPAAYSSTLGRLALADWTRGTPTPRHEGSPC